MATLKNAVIYVFSGTGNTKIAADLTGKYMKYFGVDTLVYDVRKNQAGIFENVPDPNDYDICGFAYPVHAANTPRFFIDFVKQLPETRGRKVGMKAFIFSTAGSPSKRNSASSRSLCSALRNRGLLPAMDFHMVMPSNLGSNVNEIEAKYMRIHAEKMAYMLAYKVRNRMFEAVTFGPFGSICSLFGKLQRPVARSNGKKYSVNEEACIRCNICYNTCPAANITEKDGFPFFGGSCTMCMGCVAMCPAAAIIPGRLDKYKIPGTWDYKALLKNDDITDDALNSKEAPKITGHRKYYEKNNAEYERLFGEMIDREEAKRRRRERMSANQEKKASGKGYEPEEDNKNNADRERPGSQETSASGTDVQEEEIAYATPVQSLQEIADINATIKLNELKDLAADQLKEQDEFIDKIFSDSSLDDPGDQVSDNAHDGSRKEDAEADSDR